VSGKSIKKKGFFRGRQIGGGELPEQKFQGNPQIVGGHRRGPTTTGLPWGKAPVGGGKSKKSSGNLPRSHRTLSKVKTSHHAKGGTPGRRKQD